MKLLFGMLLLLCAGFFAFMQWGGALTGANKNSPVAGDLNAEKIRLLDMPPAKPVQGSVAAPVQQFVIVSAPIAPPVHAARPDAAPAAASAPLPATTAPLPVPVRPPAPVHTQGGKVVANKSCMEWGEFSGTDMALASKALAELKLGDNLAQRTVEYASGYWVYIPPLKNKTAVNNKIEEIRAAGIEEYFVVQVAGKWHNAISLGVFKTEEAAKNFQASLRKKGLRATRVGERKSKLKFTVFVLKRIDSGVAARLAKLQKDFANSELKAMPCDN
jgi:hypothetical protein